MKKITALIISFVLIISLVPAGEFTALAEDRILIEIDGKTADLGGAEPMLVGGRTLIPVRAVSDAMGAKVEWIESSRKIVITKEADAMEYDGKKHTNAKAVCEFKLGSDRMTIRLLQNGKEIFSLRKMMDIHAKAYNGTTYLPVRYLGYGLGYSVDWVSPKVIYSFTGKQTTDFKIDPNVKYPGKYPDGRCTYSYYDGYEDIKIVNGDDGYIAPAKDKDGNIIKNVYNETVMQYYGNFFSYAFTPTPMIYDSEKLDIDLDERTPAENIKSFAEVYDYIVNGEVSYGPYGASLGYLTSDKVASVGYQTERTDPYAPYQKGEYKWSILNLEVETNFENYSYYGDYGIVERGLKNQSVMYSGATKTTLQLLNAFFGEDGQRIWKLLYDYYNLAGKQYVAPRTLWTYENWYDRIITKEVLEAYGLEFVEDIVYLNANHLLKIRCPNLGREVTIHYMAIAPDYGHALLTYEILFN